MNFGDRLVQLIDAEFEGNRKKLSQKSGIPYTTLNEFAIKKKRSPKIELVDSILDVSPRINPMWLYTGAGPMYKRDGGTQSFGVAGMITQETAKAIPLIHIDIEELSLEELDLTIKSIPEKDRFFLPRFQDADFLAKTTSNSMAPIIKGGDLIAFKRILDFKYIIWGNIYAIKFKDQGIVIRKLMPGSENGAIKFVASNDVEYPHFETRMDDVEALCLILGVLSVLR
ncbi:MAG: S24 family peptidase [Bacteroidota bacterium]|nr:S24 family peptidase [Bacteroidota bacterium]MDX5448585.1 S24 family peptidase [Bacteroidota bacterium]